MPVPLGRTVMTFIRYLLRPINNTMTKKFKHSIDNKPNSWGYLFFVKFGNGANRFEVTMNRIIIQQ